MAYPVSITYKWFDLMNANYLSRVKQNVANFEYDNAGVPYSNTSVVYWKTFRDRIITISWVVKASDSNDLYVKMFNLKKLLDWSMWELLITKHWKTIKYNAMVDSTSDMFDENTYNTNWIEFKIDFYCTTWFWESTTETIIEDSITDIEVQNIPANNDWNAVTECIITLWVVDDSWWIINIWIVNTHTNKEIEVDWTFVNWDEIIIDWINKTVQTNWVWSSFSWYFLELIPDLNLLEFTLDDNTQSIDITISFYEKYM